MKYIYLDQNMWVALARTYAGKQPEYEEVVKKIEEKVNSDEWAFPLSVIHYMETEARLDDRSRKDLAYAMSKISRNYAIVPYPWIDKSELYNSVNSLYGWETTDLKTSVIRKDFMAMVGLDGKSLQVTGLDHRSDKEEIVQYLIDALPSQPLFELLLSGTPDRDRVEQQKIESLDSVKAFEADRKKILSYPKEFRERIFIATNFIAIHGETLTELAQKYGRDIIPPSTFESPEKTMRFLESTPCFNVRCKLTYDMLNQQDKKIHLNDHKDISFLSTAIPYCDVVLTERLWVHYIKQRGLDQKYNTLVSRDLNSLLQYD